MMSDREHLEYVLKRVQEELNWLPNGMDEIPKGYEAGYYNVRLMGIQHVVDFALENLAKKDEKLKNAPSREQTDDFKDNPLTVI